MGKTGKWLRSFLGSGKREKDNKEKEKETQSQALVPCQSVSSSSKSQTPKEKRRWSFRRSVHKDSNSKDSVPTAAVAATTTTTTNSVSVMPLAENEEEQRKHAIDVAAATAEAADATIAAAQAAAAVISLAFNPPKPTPAEEMAALKIQSAFRSHLAKKALRALKGLVKLQAWVRGHLVRKQAAATLRCMQALVTVQARARAQRILAVVVAQSSSPISRRLSVHGRSLHEHHQRFRHSYDMDRRGTDDNIKIVEMDIGEARGISRGKMSNVDRSEQMFWVNRRSLPPLPKIDRAQSPAPSTGRTETFAKACSSHFDEFSMGTTQSSPQYFSAMSRPYSSRGYRIEYAESVCNDYSSFPNYMANTESSRAKARSQSAPKQRPDSYERTPSRRPATMESRSVPRGYRMQRSSSQVGSTRKGCQYQHPASIRLDRSEMSLQDSECGSTCSVLTNTNYARPLVGIEVKTDN